MQHIAMEGRVWVLSCNQYVVKENLPDWLESDAKEDEVICRGGSLICNPFGGIVAGPLFAEGLLYAQIDLDACVRGKMDLDVCGHYSREDLFKLTVRE